MNSLDIIIHHSQKIWKWEDTNGYLHTTDGHSLICVTLRH